MTLHPSMTLLQMQVWCQLNRKAICIDWRVVGKDRIPIAVVVPDMEDEEALPAFLRPQCGPVL